MYHLNSPRLKKFDEKILSIPIDTRTHGTRLQTNPKEASVSLMVRQGVLRDRFDKIPVQQFGQRHKSTREFLAKFLDTIPFQDLTAGTGEIALRPFAGEFSGAPHGLCLFSSALFRGFFVGGAEFHLAKDTFALEFFLENLEGLVNIIVSYDDIHY